MIEILNENNFGQIVLEDAGKVLVEFFATWCPHCQRMMPVIGDVATRVSVPVYQVDIDQSPDLAQEYAPNGVPCFVLFEGGRAKEYLVGEQPEANLIALAA